METSNILISASALEEQFVQRYVKTFLDIVVLAILNGEPMHGYKIIAAVHKEFGVLLSPGSLYPLLHSLEKNKLIESRLQKGKKVYNATLKGKRRFQDIFTAYKRAMWTLEKFIKHMEKAV